MLEIEESQSSKRLRFPVTRSSRLLPGDNFPFQLPAKKVAKMCAKEAFELFKVGVAAAGVGKRLLLFPSCKELLHSIPIAKEGVPLSFRQERRGRSGTIAINPQFRKTGSAI